LTRLVLGTRGSALARTQSEWVAGLLRARGHEVVLDTIVTRGDREQDRPVPQLGGKGLFTAELEQALRDGSIHLAVHSLKDLPTEDADGLCVAAIPEREDHRDALVSKGGLRFEQLARGARVGTASLRRQALIRHVRPDLEVAPLRGNVDTRVRKAQSGELDAVILAAAGLKRLGRGEVICDYLDFLPAPAQGALGIQARAGDETVREALSALHHDPTARCAAAERELLHALGGGCSVPVGAHAVVSGGALKLDGLVAAVDGSRVIRADASGRDPRELGRAVAAQLMDQGAKEILDAATH
jgi:hydroxymethylbilane synthase